jgi:hypothetical protein
MVETEPTNSKPSAAPERKVALITGASGGIGEAFAECLAADGYALVLVARSEAELGRISGLITSRHDLPVAMVATDLTHPEAVGDILAALEARGARPEIVVNNAGFGLQGPADEADLTRQLTMVDLNCRALTELTLRFIGDMRANGRGGVINIASTASFLPGPNMAVYYATKAYVLSLSEGLAGELSGSGVTVTAVCPGPTRTGFQATAGMTGSRLVRLAPMMSARRVAELGYAGFKRGRRVVVPGLGNKMVGWAMPFVPRAILLPAVRFLQSGGK